MRRRLVTLSALLVIVPAWAGQDSSSPAADEIRRLQREVQLKQQQLLAQYRQVPASYAPKFLDIAQKNPKDAAAFEALTWIVTNAGTSPEAGKAAELLVDHADKIDATLVPRLRVLRDANLDKLLRAVMEKNPKMETQGHAALTLAQVLKQRAEQGQPAARKEAEKLFEQVIEKYGDVKAARGTLADQARSELAEIKSAIVVGGVIPEIDGEDMDGKKFKISEYRGKVVMLDFWGHW